MKNIPTNAPKGFDRVKCLKSETLKNRKLFCVVETDSKKKARLEFEALSADIWHLTFLPPNVKRPSPTPFVTWQSKKHIRLELKKTPQGLLISGPRLTLQISRDPWAMRFINEKGAVVFSENPGDVNGLGRPFVLPLGYVREKQKILLVAQSFHLNPDEHLFGLGEKFTRLEKTHQRIITWTQDALGSTSERSHKNIPLLISTRGFGLFLNTGARITWELATESCQSYTVKVEDSALDAYLIFGPAPTKILKLYSDLSGYAPVPPKWSFGLWLSSGGTYRTQKEVESLIDGIEKNKIPADVIHIDPWWMKRRTYCDFRWDMEAFPDPEGLIKKLHERGLKLCLWEHPYISAESDLFEFGKREGFFVKRPDGEVYVIDYGLSLAPRPDGLVHKATPKNSWNARVAIIDLTNPKANAWFQDLHRPLLRMGVDVFKTDFGEDIPRDAVFSNGQTGATMHNLFPLLYNRTVFEVTQQERGYGLVWSRSGTAGSQRFPVCWSGDPAANFESLAATIRGGLSIGMSGIPFWSNDIGGYRGTPSPQLFIRWAQFGLLCSHSRMHGDSPRDPWHFGKKALSIVQKYILLRYQLFPYFYSLAHEASRTGMPVMRALPLVFPDDPNVFDKDLEYMLGPWILAAPIYSQDGKRNIYLPVGRWIDYWTGKTFEGPKSIQVRVPLESFPLFVRAGTIIPMTKPGPHIPEGRIDWLGIDVYPHKDSKFVFYEDEGTSELACSESQKEIVFTWKFPFPRDLSLRFKNIGPSQKLILEVRAPSPYKKETTELTERRPLHIAVGQSRSGTLRLLF